MNALTFIVPGHLGQLTGGYLYDARMIEQLRINGVAVEVVELAGQFPEADERAREALTHALNALDDGARVVIDGLALGNLPDIAERHATRLDMTALIHMPLADDQGIDEDTIARFLISERRALAAMHDVIVTSAFMAQRLSHYGVELSRIHVVEPGVTPAALAQGSGDEIKLLCVGTVSPVKGQDILVEALAKLQDLPWQCDCIGSLERAPQYVQCLRARIDQLGLNERIHLPGPFPPATLDEFYHRADLCILPSRFESYGMVVDEAMAHGLPMVTTNAGALAYTVPDDAAIKVEPDDVDALSDALRLIMTHAYQRAHLTEGARIARSRLRDWPSAGRAFLHALNREKQT
ncbi:glycosyltransferase family 4 protein [Phytohalomonas tamaricis]|uniref:glycosyltransferase family 4 protein n=1 Tax=Phytohalomonas tamaricis TaxID=2081032 RepID=UPI0021D43C31|nr:glycosyltransferase family 4 protein [Phytohalomonas tamaricis]